MWIDELIAAGPVVTDGAWGTQLQAHGLSGGACPDEWNLSHPDIVEQVPRRVRRGRQPDRVDQHVSRQSHRAGQLQPGGSRGGDQSRRRARFPAGRWAIGHDVFASIGPTGKMLMAGEVSEDELRAAFAEQARRPGRRGRRGVGHRDDGGAGGSGTGGGGRQADRAAGGRLCGVRFRGESRPHDDGGDAGSRRRSDSRRPGRMWSAPTAGRALRVTWTFADACGRPPTGRCGSRPTRESRKSSVGEIVYRTSPEQFASYVPALLAAGAQFVGGCCGTSPAYIAALCKEIRREIARARAAGHPPSAGGSRADRRGRHAAVRDRRFDLSSAETTTGTRTPTRVFDLYQMLAEIEQPVRRAFWRRRDRTVPTGRGVRHRQRGLEAVDACSMERRSRCRADSSRARSRTAAW